MPIFDTKRKKRAAFCGAVGNVALLVAVVCTVMLAFYSIACFVLDAPNEQSIPNCKDSGKIISYDSRT